MQTHRQHGDLTSILLLFENKESRLKMEASAPNVRSVAVKDNMCYIQNRTIKLQLLMLHTL
jgi:hypothetical protein